jgi:hypothetical protein
VGGLWQSASESVQTPASCDTSSGRVPCFVTGPCRRFPDTLHDDERRLRLRWSMAALVAPYACLLGRAAGSSRQATPATSAHRRREHAGAGRAGRGACPLRFHLLVPTTSTKSTCRCCWGAWAGALEEASESFQPPAGLQLLLPRDQAGLSWRSRTPSRRCFTAGRLRFQRVTFAAVKAMTKALDDDHTYFMLPEAYELHSAERDRGSGYSGVRRGPASSPGTSTKMALPPVRDQARRRDRAYRQERCPRSRR